MFALTQPRVAGVLAGYVADLVFADPRRGHPVAGFGAAAAALERVTYRDDEIAGALHTGLLIGGLTVLGASLQRAVGRRGPVWSAVGTAAATWTALGGTSLLCVAESMAELLDRGDVEAARDLLPSLCGRDPAVLDEPDLTRATLESVAENTSDAQVAPLLWAAVGGTPAVLAYRGINTLDAMIGHRSPRYARFGWAAARLDDAANYVAARLTAALTALVAPLAGGSPSRAVRVWRRDAARHPSPNAGAVEAAFAGALDVRLGGPTQYHHQLQIRPTLGDGRAPSVTDLRRAVLLSRAVQTVTLIVCGTVLIAAGRSGR